MQLSDKKFHTIVGALCGVGTFLILCIFSEVPSLQERELAGMTLSVFCSFVLLTVLCLPLLWKGPRKFGRLASIACFSMSPILCFFMVDSLNGVNVFQYDLWTSLFNLGAYAGLLLIVFAIVGSGRISVILASVIGVFFGITNHFVSAFRGSPFLPWDILSVKTAFSVANNYKFEIGLPVIFPVVLLLLYILLCLRIDPKFLTINRGAVKAFTARGAILAVCGVFCAVTLLTSVPSQMGIMEFAWNQTSAYRANGSFLNFLLNTKYLMIDKPQDYSIAKVNEIVENLPVSEDPSHVGVTADLDGGAESAKRPNLIVIMNESLSDLSVVGDFTTTEDPLPFLHSLTENTIKGNAYVSVHGGSTCNTEFEMLTGSTNGFLPSGSIAYQQYVKQETPALPNILKPLNYNNAALHPYYASGWNRPQVYPLMGFNQFLTKDDWNAPYYIRSYVSDESDYDKVIQMYEEKPEHENLFLFNVTMQNHSGYTDEGYQANIHITDMEGSYPQTEQYLSLVRQSDQAFQNLVEYFQQQSEPTVIMMFGDHQPAIEASFYEELYGKKLEDLTLEELQKRYITPFVIWANYDIEEQEIDALSANYLSTLLLDTAGIELPLYNQFLKNLSQTMPVINGNGMIDKDGNNYSFEEETPYDELINEYRILQYNNLFDSKNRVEEIFQIP